MSRLFARIAGFFSNRTLEGIDKAGNRYFTRKEEIDGIIEWICWLNGQRKRAPTPEEMMELEARRERVKQNVALLKKEEEERRAKEGSKGKHISGGKVGGPDLKSFIQQFPGSSEVEEVKGASGATGGLRNSQDKRAEKEKDEPLSSEPTGSGATFRPGAWQPPT